MINRNKNGANSALTTNKQSGFSLLEVMVVLVIIGMIIGLVAPNILGNQEQAERDKAKIDIQGLENAMTMYRSQNRVFPSTEQGLEALVTATDIAPVPKRFPEGGFISDLPKDPWGNDYQLVSPGEVNPRFDIFSMGPDGEAGTEDDIGNWDDEDVQ